MLDLAMGFAADGTGNFGIDDFDVIDGFGVGGGGSHGWRLVNEFKNGWQRTFDGILAARIGFGALADGIGNVPDVPLELADEMHLSGSGRKKQFQEALVVARHGKNGCHLFNQRFGNRLTAFFRNIDPFLLRKHTDGLATGKLAATGPHPCGQDNKIFAVAHHVPKQPLGHRASAGIAGANE